nr:type I restriction-modification enzyme R subunit C-terminal domain-containing protein [Ilyobacter polytropus]
MIATGTDVKPLECLLFMRDVRSRNYFEQMIGRGTRVIEHEALRKVTPSAVSKNHFIIVDAVGVTKSTKTDSRPLERKRGVSLKELLNGVLMGDTSEDTYLSLASRLSRLEQDMTDKEKKEFCKHSKDKPINITIHDLLDTHNPDKIEEEARRIFDTDISQVPDEDQLKEGKKSLGKKARMNFNGNLIEYLVGLKKSKEQIIDEKNLDEVIYSGWDKNRKDISKEVVEEFKGFIEENRDEIAALRLYYDTPYRRREVTFDMIKELMEILKKAKPRLAPLNVWRAYEEIEGAAGKSPKDELVALVSLVRRVCGIDEILTPYDSVVNRNFKNWIFDKHSGAKSKFTEKQMEWLRMLKDHIATSFHVEVDDLEYTPFISQGGIGGMYNLFGENMNDIIDELNEVLAA